MALPNGEFEISFSHGKLHGSDEEVVRLGFVRFTRGLRSKRILFSKSDHETVSNSDQLDSPPVKIPLKRSKTEPNSSVLESLHQDILIRVLCHVDHDDLERLKRVSKTIRNAVFEAKKSHFDYSTPRKTLPFRDPTSILEQDTSLSDQDEAMEPPNAPVRRRKINRESDLSRISMVLFK
ncbi:hypothetical protein Bca4012_003258 [Brassica carinata]|uniref:F-box domain-containing protein n=2 Tax=Brassica TaxID=3705 RepID=A0A8X7V0B5_BRACI|nr:hypothetical protein Bca52824_044121 [Brassica carinata]VDC91685.1 unnamed protein product [Brassica oleracea]